MERQIVYLKPEEISPDPDQSRKRITDEQVKGMALSIETVGVIKPIEIDDDNVIVTGEIRWRGGIEAGLETIPCIRWSGTPVERHTRQLIENLHHYELTSIERENGIYNLWEEMEKPSINSLAKILGYNQSTLSRVIEARKFRESYALRITPEVSTRDIGETMGVEPEQRVKILEKVAAKEAHSEDIRDLKKIAKASDQLLDKTLRGEISLERAKKTADSFIEVEKRVAEERPDFKISDKDKDKLVRKIADDEKKLDEYKEVVLGRSVDVISREKPTTRTLTPVGRKSPAEGLKKIVDELDIERWTLKIRLMDLDEKMDAKGYLLQILENVNKLLEFMPRD